MIGPISGYVEIEANSLPITEIILKDGLPFQYIEATLLVS